MFFVIFSLHLHDLSEKAGSLFCAHLEFSEHITYLKDISCSLNEWEYILFNTYAYHFHIAWIAWCNGYGSPIGNGRTQHKRRNYSFCHFYYLLLWVRQQFFRRPSLSFTGEMHSAFAVAYNWKIRIVNTKKNKKNCTKLFAFVISFMLYRFANGSRYLVFQHWNFTCAAIRKEEFNICIHPFDKNRNT